MTAAAPRPPVIVWSACDVAIQSGQGCPWLAVLQVQTPMTPLEQPA